MPLGLGKWMVQHCQMQSLSGLKKLVKSIFQVWPSLRGWDSEPKIFDFLDSVSLPLFQMMERNEKENVRLFTGRIAASGG